MNGRPQRAPIPTLGNFANGQVPTYDAARGGFVAGVPTLVLSLAFSGTSGSSPWTITLQVQDQDANVVSGRYWVRVALGATEYAHNDSDSSNSLAAATAWVPYSADIISGQVMDVLSDTTGEIVVTAGASSNRYLTASVLGFPAVSSGVLSASSSGDALLLESSGYLLLETGDRLLLE